VKHNLVAYLLWLVGGFGVLGIHRFYLGRWVSGLIWLLTGGLFLIGAIIDLFLIPEMVQVENLSRQLMQSGLPKPQPNRFEEHSQIVV
jgi:TM2 domain-containing membrane protein YozV